MTGEARHGIVEALADSAVEIGVVRRYPGNPRRGNVQMIAESLTMHGQYRPLVVRRADQTVLVGNHTLAAARSLGWTHVAVAYVDVDDDEAARIVLHDNRSTDQSVYDDGELVALLSALPGLSGTGWLPEDLAVLSARLAV